MNHHFKQALLRAALAFGLGWTGTAQAGLVTGSVDPAFGAVLPELSYRQDFSFNVSDSCFAGGSSGLRSISLSGCGGPVTIQMDFTIYKTSDPSLSETAHTTLVTNRLLALDGFVVGAYAVGTEVVDDLANGTLAPDKLFGLSMTGLYFQPLIAVLEQRSFFGLNYLALLGLADTEALAIDVFHKDDQGNGKLGKDGLGNDIGYRINFVDDEAIVTTTAAEIPEPATLALVLGALGALGLGRRRLRRA